MRKEANQGGTRGLQARQGCTGFSLPYDSERAYTKPPPAYFKINIGAREQAGDT